jgi:hypothetical protein
MLGNRRIEIGRAPHQRPSKASAGHVRGSWTNRSGNPVFKPNVLAWSANRDRSVPIRYAARSSGVADQETAIRWLIVLMVLCFDQLAIVLTAAASPRR